MRQAVVKNRAGYIERIGTGINRIKKSVEEHGKGNVEFSYDKFLQLFLERGYNLKKKVTENQREILKNAGILLRIGPAKGGYWKVVKMFNKE